MLPFIRVNLLVMMIDSRQERSLKKSFTRKDEAEGDTCLSWTMNILVCLSFIE